VTTTTALRITAEPGSPLITMEREVAAPRDLVYRCYTEPALLAQWLGPRRLGLRVDQFDLRHGGAWRYVNIEADGSAEYGFRGVFHGEPSPDQMVQTFEFDGAPGHVQLDTLNLVEHDGRTLIRTTSSFQSVEARDAMIAAGMEGGVREGFERLDELVARIVA
jgi:uncharacterized protein YndB with AHSA1/START domain